MEALLSKVRIVGLQYDQGTIHTGDMVYDYNILNGHSGESIPYHGLNTLRNGGGKGVFFQCLFQPLDPLCDWKNGKNQVVHFFFNEHERPMYYTFHIVEEWLIGEKKLMI